MWILEKSHKNLYQSTLLSIGLYTNTPGTLTNRNTLSQIVACAGSGYAPISVPASSWSVSLVQGTDPIDDAAVLTLPGVDFTPASNWGNVSGAYAFDATNGIALAWRDFTVANIPTAYAMPAGAKLRAAWLDELLTL
jgi:hypothetical protein